MSFPFALFSLALSCVAVAVVYAMTGSEEPERWGSDALSGFLMMFGGVFALGVVVFALTRWIG